MLPLAASLAWLLQDNRYCVSNILDEALDAGTLYLLILLYTVGGFWRKVKFSEVLELAREMHQRELCFIGSQGS